MVLMMVLEQDGREVRVRCVVVVVSVFLTTAEMLRSTKQQ